MYLNYFGLNTPPFSTKPDTRFLFTSPQHSEALNHLLHGISSDDCFTLLTGNVGMGKTTLCHCLLDQLPEDTEAALLETPCVSVVDLLVTICHALGVVVTGEAQTADEYVEALHSHLLAAHDEGRTLTLVVDEAQNTSLDQLEQLCSLARLKAGETQLLKIVLVGQTELSQILNQQDASQISKDITSRYHLLPLDLKSTRAYVQHRLLVAGVSEQIFSKGALQRVFELSHGVPRFVNVLSDEALEITCSQKKFLVSGSIVGTAAKNVLGNVEEKKVAVTRKQLWAKLLCWLAIFLIGGGAVSWYFSQQPYTPDQAPESSPVSKTQDVAKTVEQVPESKVKAKPKIAPNPKGMQHPKKDVEEGATIRIVPLEVNE